MEPRVALVSESDFLALPETTDKVELIDGEVVVTPSPSVRHQVVVQRLILALSSWASEQPKPVFIGHAPLDVRVAPGRILQPDVFVILGRVPLDHEGPLVQVPDLCVEVLSTDRVYDRVTKRFLYAAAGVREYWVVEPKGPIERWHGPGMAELEEISDTLSTALLPGLSIQISSLVDEAG